VTYDPFEFAAQRSEKKSRSWRRRTVHHQAKAAHQRELGANISKLDRAAKAALEAKNAAKAAGASKQEAKAAAQAAFTSVNDGAT